jgi:glutamate synthase (NADPH/NADH) large chain/glutamate synthase (ferredoxin)
MTTAAEIQHLQQHGLYSRPTSTMPAASASWPTSRARKSHAIVLQGLKILENLDHRGAVGADKLMGDGAGILIQLPDLL